MTMEIKNLPISIKARLKNMSEDLKMPTDKILSYYAMERFLHRLSETKYNDRLVLKGALMFTVWDIKNRRVTMDIDFLSYLSNKQGVIEKVVKEICLAPVIDDGIVFDVSTMSSKKIKEGAEYEGVRTKFKAYLGKTRIQMQLDFGFGDKIYPGPTLIKYPTLLGSLPPEIRGYSVESLVSEKFEAMMTLGDANSRLKDFYDIWLLITEGYVDKEKLMMAIKSTFENRGTEIPSENSLFDRNTYSEISSKQKDWEAFLDSRQITGVKESISKITKEIESFMKSIVLDINNEKILDNDKGMEL